MYVDGDFILGTEPKIYNEKQRQVLPDNLVNLDDLSSLSGAFELDAINGMRHCPSPEMRRQKSDMARPLKVHKHYARSICDKCGCSFLRSDDLKKHRRIVHAIVAPSCQDTYEGIKELEREIKDVVPADLDPFDLDVQSTISISDSVFSNTNSKSTTSSTEETMTAIDQISIWLLKDSKIAAVLEEATHVKIPDTFDLNVSHLLRLYSSDLRLEAKTTLERDAANLIQQRRHYIALRMNSFCVSGWSGQSLELHLDKVTTAKKDLLERFLDQRGSFESPQEIIAAKASSGDFDPNPGEAMWPNIHQIEYFLLQSTAMHTFQRKLKRMVQNFSGIRELAKDNGKVPSSERIEQAESQQLATKLPQLYSDEYEWPKMPQMLEIEAFEAHHDVVHVQGQESQLVPEPQETNGDTVEVDDLHSRGETLHLQGHKADKDREDLQSRQAEGCDLSGSGNKELATCGLLSGWYDRCLSSERVLLCVKLASSLKNSLSALRERLLWPRIPFGSRRVKWTCDCGRRLYWDIPGITAHDAEELAVYFDATDTLTGEPSCGSSSSGSVTTPQEAHISLSSGSDTKQPAGALQKESILSLDHIQISEPDPQLANCTPRFLEICVDTSEYSKTVGEADITNTTTDGGLFSLISHIYYRERSSRGFYQIPIPKFLRRYIGRRQLRWSFLKPTSISFRKVSFHPHSHASQRPTTQSS